MTTLPVNVLHDPTAEASAWSRIVVVALLHSVRTLEGWVLGEPACLEANVTYEQQPDVLIVSKQVRRLDILTFSSTNHAL